MIFQNVIERLRVRITAYELHQGWTMSARPGIGNHAIK
jgi:hypothetical protein